MSQHLLPEIIITTTTTTTGTANLLVIQDKDKDATTLASIDLFKHQQDCLSIKNSWSGTRKRSRKRKNPQNAHVDQSNDEAQKTGSEKKTIIENITSIATTTNTDVSNNIGQLPHMLNNLVASDVEHFQGRIVYNSDSNTYIIDAVDSNVANIAAETAPTQQQFQQQHNDFDSEEISAVTIGPAIITEAVKSVAATPTNTELTTITTTITPKTATATNPKIHSFRVVSAHDVNISAENYNSNKRTSTNIIDNKHISEKQEKLQQIEAKNYDCQQQLSSSSLVYTRDKLDQQRVQQQHQKPILMCFICKLSFGTTRTFSLHAYTEHTLNLLDLEKYLLECREHSSAIIQRNMDERPQISFLEPIEYNSSGATITVAATFGRHSKKSIAVAAEHQNIVDDSNNDFYDQADDDIYSTHNETDNLKNNQLEHKEVKKKTKRKDKNKIEDHERIEMVESNEDQKYSLLNMTESTEQPEKQHHSQQHNENSMKNKMDEISGSSIISSSSSNNYSNSTSRNSTKQEQQQQPQQIIAVTPINNGSFTITRTTTILNDLAKTKTNNSSSNSSTSSKDNYNNNSSSINNSNNNCIITSTSVTTMTAELPTAITTSAAAVKITTTTTTETLATIATPVVAVSAALVIQQAVADTAAADNSTDNLSNSNTNSMFLTTTTTNSNQGNGYCPSPKSVMTPTATSSSSSASSSSTTTTTTTLSSSSSTMKLVPDFLQHDQQRYVTRSPSSLSHSINVMSLQRQQQQNEHELIPTVIEKSQQLQQTVSSSISSISGKTQEQQPHNPSNSLNATLLVFGQEQQQQHLTDTTESVSNIARAANPSSVNSKSNNVDNIHFISEFLLQQQDQQRQMQKPHFTLFYCPEHVDYKGIDCKTCELIEIQRLYQLQQQHQQQLNQQLLTKMPSCITAAPSSTTTIAPAESALELTLEPSTSLLPSQLFTAAALAATVTHQQHPLSSQNQPQSQQVSLTAVVSSSGTVTSSPGSFTIGACSDHINGRPLGVDCTRCEMILNSARLTGSVQMSTRNSCKTLKCPQCNWHYKYQETLEIHMREKHPDGESACGYCLAGQQHPRLARGESYSCGYKPYRCEICNYSTTTKGNLSIHMQSDKHLNNMQELNSSQNMVAAAAAAAVAAVAVATTGPAPQANKMSGILSTATSPSPSSVTTVPSSSAAAAIVESMTTTPSSSVTTCSKIGLITSSQQQELIGLPAISASSIVTMSPIINKPKPSFRCDICSYDTSVARNLRIHMTSEKHTHNMAILQSNLKHLQAFSFLQQQHQVAAAAVAAAQQQQREQHEHSHQQQQLLIGASRSYGSNTFLTPEVTLADFAYNQALMFQFFHHSNQASEREHQASMNCKIQPMSSPTSCMELQPLQQLQQLQHHLLQRKQQSPKESSTNIKQSITVETTNEEVTTMAKTSSPSSTTKSNSSTLPANATATAAATALLISELTAAAVAAAADSDVDVSCNEHTVKMQQPQSATDEVVYDLSLLEPLQEQQKQPQQQFHFDSYPTKLYSCLVCAVHHTNSLDELNQHLLIDRTHQLYSSNGGTSTTPTCFDGNATLGLNSNKSSDIMLFLNNNYVCRLCNYKTNLKANFQLHSKTDKHLQKLNFINHVLEGGVRNKYKLKLFQQQQQHQIAISASPSSHHHQQQQSQVQLKCNCCDFYTNSIQKLSLHAQHRSHETMRMIFQHLLYLMQQRAQLEVDTAGAISTIPPTRTTTTASSPSLTTTTTAAASTIATATVTATATTSAIRATTAAPITTTTTMVSTTNITVSERAAKTAVDRSSDFFLEMQPSHQQKGSELIPASQTIHKLHKSFVICQLCNYVANTLLDMVQHVKSLRHLQVDQLVCLQRRSENMEPFTLDDIFKLCVLPQTLEHSNQLLQYDQEIITRSLSTDIDATTVNTNSEAMPIENDPTTIPTVELGRDTNVDINRINLPTTMSYACKEDTENALPFTSSSTTVTAVANTSAMPQNSLAREETVSSAKTITIEVTKDNNLADSKVNVQRKQGVLSAAAAVADNDENDDDNNGDGKDHHSLDENVSSVDYVDGNVGMPAVIFKCNHQNHGDGIYNISGGSNTCDYFAKTKQEMQQHYESSHLADAAEPDYVSIPTNAAAIHALQAAVAAATAAAAAAITTRRRRITTTTSTGKPFSPRYIRSSMDIEADDCGVSDCPIAIKKERLDNENDVYNYHNKGSGHIYRGIDGCNKLLMRPKLEIPCDPDYEIENNDTADKQMAMMIRTPTSPVQCPLCQLMFTQQQQLEQHLMHVHSVNQDGLARLLLLVDNSMWRNLTSSTTATTSNDANSDTNANSITTEILTVPITAGVPTEACYCQVCGVSFKHEQHLLQHSQQQKHFIMKNGEYLCLAFNGSTNTGNISDQCCTVLFPTLSSMISHYKDTHMSLVISERHVYKYRCKQCSLAFKTQDKLTTHTLYHAMRNATKCSTCQRNFRSTIALQKHMELVHHHQQLPQQQRQHQQQGCSSLTPPPTAALVSLSSTPPLSSVMSSAAPATIDLVGSSLNSPTSSTAHLVECDPNSITIKSNSSTPPATSASPTATALAQQRYVANITAALLNQNQSRDELVESCRENNSNTSSSSGSQQQLSVDIMQHLQQMEKGVSLLSTSHTHNSANYLFQQRYQSLQPLQNKTQHQQVPQLAAAVAPSNGMPMNPMDMLNLIQLHHLMSLNFMNLAPPLIFDGGSAEDSLGVAGGTTTDMRVVQPSRSLSQSETEAEIPQAAVAASTLNLLSQTIPPPQATVNVTTATALSAAAATGSNGTATQQLLEQQQRQPSPISKMSTNVLCNTNIPSTIAANNQSTNNNNSQKRARTRITDDQLKILRGHFDINNSPSEESIMDMSQKANLPMKVVKHWFRNTLFKERQRNKDSPYNFNNPPSTTLNLEEYERTGQAKVTSLNGVEVSTTATLLGTLSTDSAVVPQLPPSSPPPPNTPPLPPTTPPLLPSTSSIQTDCLATHINFVTVTASDKTHELLDRIQDPQQDISSVCRQSSTPISQSVQMKTETSDQFEGIRQQQLQQSAQPQHPQLRKIDTVQQQQQILHEKLPQLLTPATSKLLLKQQQQEQQQQLHLHLSLHHPHSDTDSVHVEQEAIQMQQVFAVAATTAASSVTRQQQEKQQHQGPSSVYNSYETKSESGSSDILSRPPTPNSSSMSNAPYASMNELLSQQLENLPLNSIAHTNTLGGVGIRSTVANINNMGPPKKFQMSGKLFEKSSILSLSTGTTQSQTQTQQFETNSNSSIASSSMASSSGKRANRTRFTDYQIKVLQEFFENNSYPKDSDLEYLSKLLLLSPRVIVVWFQNARQKQRKIYENQPNNSLCETEEKKQNITYTCKKCNLVFQRYYELIRHQKNHCFKEENNKKSAKAQIAAAQLAQNLSSEDSNSSMDITNTSAAAAVVAAAALQHTLHTHAQQKQQQNVSAVVATFSGDASSSIPCIPGIISPGLSCVNLTSANTPLSATTSPQNLRTLSKSTSSSLAEVSPTTTPTPPYQERECCRSIEQKQKQQLQKHEKLEGDKCNTLSFDHYEHFREHQLIHIINPGLFPTHQQQQQKQSDVYSSFGNIINSLQQTSNQQQHQSCKKRKYSETSSIADDVSSLGGASSITGDYGVLYTQNDQQQNSKRYNFLYEYFMENEHDIVARQQLQRKQQQQQHQNETDADEVMVFLTNFYKKTESSKRSSYDYLYQYYLKNEEQQQHGVMGFYDQQQQKPNIDYLLQYYQLNESSKFFQLDASTKQIYDYTMQQQLQPQQQQQQQVKNDDDYNNDDGGDDYNNTNAAVGKDGAINDDDNDTQEDVDDIDEDRFRNQRRRNHHQHQYHHRGVGRVDNHYQYDKDHDDILIDPITKRKNQKKYIDDDKDNACDEENANDDHAKNPVDRGGGHNHNGRHDEYDREYKNNNNDDSSNYKRQKLNDHELLTIGNFENKLTPISRDYQFHKGRNNIKVNYNEHKNEKEKNHVTEYILDHNITLNEQQVTNVCIQHHEKSADPNLVNANDDNDDINSNKSVTSSTPPPSNLTAYFQNLEDFLDATMIENQSHTLQITNDNEHVNDDANVGNDHIGTPLSTATTLVEAKATTTRRLLTVLSTKANKKSKVTATSLLVTEKQQQQHQNQNKRLRTTILPEQLNFLYECYQSESNPTRKMLEEISKKVNLKKRVVQVWFQNSRAKDKKSRNQRYVAAAKVVSATDLIAGTTTKTSAASICTVINDNSSNSNNSNMHYEHSNNNSNWYNKSKSNNKNISSSSTVSGNGNSSSNRSNNATVQITTPTTTRDCNLCQMPQVNLQQHVLSLEHIRKVKELLLMQKPKVDINEFDIQCKIYNHAKKSNNNYHIRLSNPSSYSLSQILKEKLFNRKQNKIMNNGDNCNRDDDDDDDDDDNNDHNDGGNNIDDTDDNDDDDGICDTYYQHSTNVNNTVDVPYNSHSHNYDDIGNIKNKHQTKLQNNRVGDEGDDVCSIEIDDDNVKFKIDINVPHTETINHKPRNSKVHGKDIIKHIFTSNQIADELDELLF